MGRGSDATICFSASSLTLLSVSRMAGEVGAASAAIFEAMPRKLLLFGRAIILPIGTSCCWGYRGSSLAASLFARVHNKFLKPYNLPLGMQT